MYIYIYIGIGGGRKEKKEGWGHIHRHRETCTWKMESMVFHNYDLDFPIPTHVRCPHNNKQMQLAEFPFLPHFLSILLTFLFLLFFFPSFLFFLHILSLQLHQINIPFLTLRSWLHSSLIFSTSFYLTIYIYLYCLNNKELISRFIENSKREEYMYESMFMNLT